MNIAIKKPILVSGVSLSFLLWFWQIFSNSVGEFAEIGFWSLILLSSLLVFIRPKKEKIHPPTISLTPITSEILEETKHQVETLINLLINETNNFTPNNLTLSPDTFKKQLSLIQSKYQDKIQSPNTSKAEIVILSNNQLNSNILKNILEKNENLNRFTYQTITISSLDQDKYNQLLLNYDLVLFLIQGDITESEKEILKELALKRQQIILAFNQTEYHIPEENKEILKKIENNTTNIIPQENIITINTNNQIVKIRKYSNEKDYQESLETLEANCENLINKLTTNNDQQNLFITTAYRRTCQLKQNIEVEINSLRKQKALPIVEKYQWIAASATLANPFASLDLLAVGAINTQMIIDLGKIYQQKITLNQAQQISLELAKLIINLGIVEISTQTITTILKTNTITYIAGGVIQGISAAYLTRICSLSLIEYLESQQINVSTNNSKINLQNIKEKLEKVFKENHKQTFINSFIQKTTHKLGWKTV